MSPHKQKFHHEWMSSDIKPSKNARMYRKVTGSWRMRGRQEIQNELRDLDQTVFLKYSNEVYFKSTPEEPQTCSDCFRVSCDCPEPEYEPCDCGDY